MKVTRMLSILFLVSGLACQGAIPNPEPVKQPAAWAAEREKAQRESTPVAQARASAPADEPLEHSPAPLKDPPAPLAAPKTQTQTPTPTPTQGASSNDVVIARVAGESIDVSELLKQWMHRDPADVFQQVNRLVANRLVGLESARLALVPDEAQIEQRYKEAVDDIEKAIQKKYEGVQLDKFVDSVLGLDPLKYRETIRSDARRGWFAERCVRAFVLQSEHANVRLIAVKSEDDLKQCQAELAAGTAFEEVAKKHSMDSSAKEGGRIAPVVKGESPMGKLAFNTPIGEVGGPQYEQGAWLLVKIDSRPKPLEGDWKTVGAEIEKSLAGNQIDDIEYKQWETAMQKRYQIDLSPILRLVGEPLR
ncbi:MAG: peptidylprolyl isomerase [Planctomycetes bacterium]|nr:peptidylprolyl isomerase [Planctomycetota bacterium]